MLSMSGSDWNTLGVNQAREARKAPTAKERRNAWSVALYYWDQGISADPNHLPCLLNRLHALWVLGESFTLEEESLALLKSLEFSPDRWQNIHPPNTEGHELAWEITSLPFCFESGPDYSLPPLDQYLYYLARWISERRTLVYRSEVIPFWRLVTATHPKDLQARAIIGLGLTKSLQLEGIFHLRKNQINAPTEEIKRWADACYQLALDYLRKNLEESRSSLIKTSEINLPYENCMMSLEANLNSTATYCYLTQGRWFESEIEFVKSYLKPGMTFLDVGSNIGSYTLAAAQKVGSQGKVVAFEPVSTCANILRHNVDTNQLPQVEVVQSAVGKKSGRAYLLERDDSVLSEVIDTLVGITDPVVSIERTTLDEWWTSSGCPFIDMIKIDVVSDSLDVLLGARSLIADCSPVIQIEAKGRQGLLLQETDSFLSGLDYGLFAYNPALNELSPPQRRAFSFSAINLIAVPRVRYRSLTGYSIMEDEISSKRELGSDLSSLLEED